MQPGEQPGHRTPEARPPRSSVPSQTDGRPLFGASRLDRRATPPPMRSAPSPVPAGQPRPRFEVPQPVREQLYELKPYRPCRDCSEGGIRNRQGLWAGAVAQVEVWQEGRFHGYYDLCAQHFKRLPAHPPAGWTINVIERGTPPF